MSRRTPHLSAPALRVLSLMLSEPTEGFYGLDLMDRCQIKSGTLYPLLARYAEAGWLEAEQEQIDASAAGRPRRTYYRLTAEGATGAREALAAITPAPRSVGLVMP